MISIKSISIAHQMSSIYTYQSQVGLHTACMTRANKKSINTGLLACRPLILSSPFGGCVVRY